MYSYKFKDSNVVQHKVKKNRDHVWIIKINDFVKYLPDENVEIMDNNN